MNHPQSRRSGGATLIAAPIVMRSAAAVIAAPIRERAMRYPGKQRNGR